MIKTILITGGSRGIGAATVKEFARLGYNVAFTYKNSKDKAMSLAKETGALAICADSSKQSEISAAVKQAEEMFSKIDVLVNNAGISKTGLVTDLSEEELEEIFAVNTLGAFHAVRAALPSMIRAKSGVIINVSSIWGMVGASCEVAYSASKAALIGMTKALAKEVGPSKIRVNCVAPGVIDTEMNAEFSEDDIAALCDETPLERIGSPDEIAKLIVYLSSDDASFITGQVISPNGGLVI